LRHTTTNKENTMTTNKELWITIFGNPVDGLVHHGPFESMEDASEYGEAFGQADWWVAILWPQEDES
jgi:hypothetical protein